MTSRSNVCILLCTAQGQHFLDAQLRSIERQTHTDWTIVASDDGSSDDTHVILRNFLERHPRKVNLVAGPKAGFAANFLSLATGPCLARSPFFAFCDQDDVWEDEKLERALDWLKSVPSDTPGLYCSRTRLIDETGNEIGLSPLFNRPASFANALVQNIGGGNTMVFNEAARQLLVAAGGAVNIPSHDWWLYLLTTACGGIVRYDPHPTVLYRQHGKNLIGANTSFRARAKRARMLMQGRLRSWSDQHIAALRPIVNLMTPANRHIFQEFCHARSSHVLRRVIGFRRVGLYRQTTAGNIGLLVAAVSKRI